MEMCIDRFGRKYPPPKGLGGKCIMFQHEFEKNGTLITEFIMPIDKRDMIQRISQYPSTHEIRQNETTLNRFLPGNDHNFNDAATCMTLHYNKEVFIHCIYGPADSEMFYLSNRASFFCPKNENITKSFLQSELKDKLIDYENEPKYTFRYIDEQKFEFSERPYGPPANAVVRCTVMFGKHEF
uniref:Uncharacterized protein n=1 Tax=Panagrolaimus superbus TaxID=310955 RepID=A0A914Z2N1_9BILA